MGCPVVLLHGVPMGLSVPLMGLVGDDGRRVQTGHQGSQGCILGITWQSPLTVCPLCFFCVCATQSHVPAQAMCCQCPMSLYPCVPVSACLCLIYDHVSLHTLGPCVHVCSVSTATYVNSSIMSVSKCLLSVSVSVMGFYLCVPLCLCPCPCSMNT